MATMNRELAAHQVDTAGELPDHLIPVLRYLAVAPNPLPELLDLLEPALNQNHHTLKVLEKSNPYLMLIEATREAVEPLGKEQRAKSRELNSLSPLPSALGPLQPLSSVLPKGGPR